MEIYSKIHITVVTLKSTPQSTLPTFTQGHTTLNTCSREY
jgi:hypothetical protein